jgi:gluconolactonase
LRLLADIFAFPNGIALSPDEKRLYVADYSTNRIIAMPIGEPGQVNFRANSYVFAHLHDGIGPDGLAVDAKGNVYAAHNYAGEIVVLNPNGFTYGSIKLPDDAGQLTTNVVFRDGYLYMTEAGKGEIWRVKTKIPGKPME